ncbi:MAG: hypothetical protein HOB18_10770 [Nitrospina sp.]|jgi:hypothetical protein|nr:hypothetical protein [Nitrospina sp.]
MSKKPHWSRQSKQIQHDTAFLKKAGLNFEKTPSGFNQIRLSKVKEKVVDLLIEARFEDANEPEHKLAQKIWHENIEELREA